MAHINFIYNIFAHPSSPKKGKDLNGGEKKSHKFNKYTERHTYKKRQAYCKKDKSSLLYMHFGFP